MNAVPQACIYAIDYQNDSISEAQPEAELEFER